MSVTSSKRFYSKVYSEMSTFNYAVMSEETLEKFVCTSCYNYLSYGKPRIGSTGPVCGRCNQSETVLPFINEDINKYLFPCINRFDKCKKLLYHWQVEVHERNCKSDSNDCNECQFTGNGCQLYHHYIAEHPDHVLKYPLFKVYLLEAKKWNYIHRKDNDLIWATYEVLESNLKIKLCKVGDSDSNPQVQVMITSYVHGQHCLTTEFKTVSKHGTVFEVDILQLIEEHHENTIMCHLTVKVDGELFYLNNCRRPNIRTPPSNNNTNKLQHIMDALYNNLFPKLICSSCNCYVIPPIYRCPSNHVRCEDCNNSFCYLCDNVTNWSRANDLEVFHDVIPFPCRWNCTNMFSTAKLRLHERTCRQRRYKCVEKWCSWSGSLDSLITHWHSSIPVYSNSHTMYGFDEELVEFYVTYDNEVFYWWMDQLKKEGRSVHVRKVSDVTFKSYSGKVLLTHTCNGQERQRENLVKVGGITLIKRKDFDYFGACKNYKIIFILSQDL